MKDENIDLYITDGCKHIIIENKIHARDQEKQIERYIDLIRDLDTAPENITVVYLSLDRKHPSKFSLGSLKVNEKYIEDAEGNEVSHFHSIHYKTEVMEWLKRCRYEVQNISNLNYAIEQYMDVVRIINEEYKEKAMSLADYIKAHKKHEELYSWAILVRKGYLKDHREHHPMAESVSNAILQVRKDIADVFFNNVADRLKGDLGNAWECLGS